MRSKIGTKSRLAAHLMALALLILMLVYVAPQRAGETHMKSGRQPPSQTAGLQRTLTDHDPVDLNLGVNGPLNAIKSPAAQEITHDASATLDQVRAVPEGRKAPAIHLRPPDARNTAETPTQGGNANPTPGAGSPTTPEEVVTVSSVPSAHSETVEGASIQSVSGGQKMAEPGHPTDSPSEAGETHPSVTPTSGISPGTISSSESLGLAVNPVAPENVAEQPPIPQPDESGSLVVADDSPGLAALTLLANANLEVLGDGVYWLSSRHDLEKELSAVPELGVLVLLAPIPGYHAPGLDHIKTEVVAADPGDLSPEVAERFLYLTGGVRKPVVAAALPGARGVAFFKGAYLLAKRHMSFADMLREIDPELREAGDDRDDIVHRLRRLEAASS